MIRVVNVLHFSYKYTVLNDTALIEAILINLTLFKNMWIQFEAEQENCKTYIIYSAKKVLKGCFYYHKNKKHFSGNLMENIWYILIKIFKKNEAMAKYQLYL